MSSTSVHLEKFAIPLEKIHLATQNFSPETRIGGEGGFGKVFKGQLENRTVAIDCCDPNGYIGDREFCNQLKIISTLHHQNIIPFIGYCHEGDQRISVCEYAVNGSLDQYLEDPIKMRSLTWADRLKICIGAARGLEYLHSGLGEDSRVIHRDVKSGNILLDDNLEAKICNFNLAILVERNQPQAYERTAGTRFYLDPVYERSGSVSTGSDVYSFGVVLFEMLSGMLAFHERKIGDDKPQTLISLVRAHYDAGLYNLIDHDIRDQMNMHSFNVFKEIAYRCIDWNLKDRPTMDMIIKRIQVALDIGTRRASSTVTLPGFESENRERYRIPLHEIILATRDFHSETRIEDGGFGYVVYRGQLSEPWQKCTAAFKRLDPKEHQEKRAFLDEVSMLFNLKHENIIPFVGYCDDDNEMIIVTEFASNHSLDHHLTDPKRLSRLTWAQRLKICMGAARALEYLHSGLGENRVIIHRDMKSSKILLNDNMDAKICGFGLSLLVDRDQPQVREKPAGTLYYMDPLYMAGGVVSTGSDVYAFGIVMFEMLTGLLAYHEKSIDNDPPGTLVNLVERYYDDRLEKLIDPAIRDHINPHSLYAFKKIAYRCISTNSNDRPTMKRVIKRIGEALDYQVNEATYSMATRSLRSPDSYLIPLNEIQLATGSFNPKTIIGEGGFGVVYKGKLSKSWKNCEVAIKCLNVKGCQGKKEFDTELNLVSRFHHPNIISLIGYCEEPNRMIIVYQYAANRSLDCYLIDDIAKIKRCPLKWEERLKICLGAAKGLNYLHSEHKVIHRDVKSGNILLDQNWEAKICDFGFSTEVSKNQENSYNFTKVAGTNFYMDPVYYGSGFLRKADVYSFGVVMFEMLSGRPAYRQTKFVDGNPQHLINLVRQYYENAPQKLVDPSIRDEIDDRSFVTFKEIAYQCINFISAERPTMEKIVDKIEDAIDFQELKSVSK